MGNPINENNFLLSRLTKKSRNSLSEKYKELEQEDFKIQKYYKLVSKKLVNIIDIVKYRINGNREKKLDKKLNSLSNNDLDKIMRIEIGKLYISLRKKLKERNIALVFFRDRLIRLIDEIYKKYSGVDRQGFLDTMIAIKNGFISYRRLLAKLLGDKLIGLHETINDYDNTSNEFAYVME